MDAKSSAFKAVLDDWIDCLIKSRISKCAAKQGLKDVEKKDEKSQKRRFFSSFSRHGSKSERESTRFFRLILEVSISVARLFYLRVTARTSYITRSASLTIVSPRQLKRNVNHKCGAIYLPHGFKNEACYVCSALVLPHGFTNEV